MRYSFGDRSLYVSLHYSIQEQNTFYRTFLLGAFE